MKALALLAAGALLFGSAATAFGFDLSSPDVANGSIVPAKHIYSESGCTGGNISPALAWSDPPAGAGSFAVTVYDPDAPAPGGWWHWAIFDIPSTVTKLEANAGDSRADLTPTGAVQGINDFRESGYAGPCPPQGDKPHRYVFTVYALRVGKLPFDTRAMDRTIGPYLEANALDKASFQATFGR